MLPKIRALPCSTLLTHASLKAGGLSASLQVSCVIIKLASLFHSIWNSFEPLVCLLEVGARAVVWHARKRHGVVSAEEDPSMIGLAWSHPMCQRGGGRPEGWFVDSWLAKVSTRVARGSAWGM